MAVAFDAASSGVQASGTTLSFSHTCSGSDRQLVVAVTWTGSAAISSVTYNGVAMTPIAAQSDIAGTFHSKTFFLANPPTGANTVLITASGTVTILAGSVSATGTDTAATPSIVTTTGSAFGARTQNISVAVATLLMDVFSLMNNTSTLAVSAGQTSDWNIQDATAARRSGGSHKVVAAGTQSMGWTISGSTARTYGHSIVAFPAPGAGGNSNNFFRMF